MRPFSGFTALVIALFLIVAQVANPPTPAMAKISILYTFQGGKDGGQPWSTLLLDEKTGALYGTTEVGGNNLCQNYFQFGCGTVFALSPSPSGWTETVLYRFQGGTDGAHPRTPLVPRPGGFFYGATTSGGGGTQGGVGTVYRIVRGTWKEQVVFDFLAYDGGNYPQGAIAFDDSGNLYGLTTNAGTGSAGVAFELIPNPSRLWTEQVLSSQVAIPVAGVVIDPTGNVFGTDVTGGKYNSGSVFELSPGTSGWQFTDIYSFSVPCGQYCGGAQPGGLTITKSGSLLGFAGDAGIPACPSGHSCGTVYELVKTAGSWHEKTLYEFQNLADGWGPGWGAPAIDRSGNIYGTTGGGGKYGYGTVFKLSHVNGVWQKTTLYDFPGGAGGAGPTAAGLVLDLQGNIFGITDRGGKIGGKTCKQQGCGIVYEITP